MYLLLSGPSWFPTFSRKMFFKQVLGHFFLYSRQCLEEQNWAGNQLARGSRTEFYGEHACLGPEKWKWCKGRAICKVLLWFMKDHHGNLMKVGSLDSLGPITTIGVCSDFSYHPSSKNIWEICFLRTWYEDDRRWHMKLGIPWNTTISSINEKFRGRNSIPGHTSNYFTKKIFGQKKTGFPPPFKIITKVVNGTNPMQEVIIRWLVLQGSS